MAAMSVFGDFVKLRREELSMDQNDLARELGVQQQTVSKWEQAKAVPKPQRISRLADVLRVDLSDLMRYAGYLTSGESEEAQAEEPFHVLLGQVSRLTNDQLIVLIDHGWEEYRFRVGFSLEHPRRRRPKETGG
jgi:transcriptional regulator with XRE-family HTH domain